MKKFIMLFFGVAAACAVIAAPKTVDFDKMPQASQDFIHKNFPNEKIKMVEMDREASWDKYTVYFNSGSQVSFEGGSGDCSQIIMRNGVVPAAAVPNKILSYVESQYPAEDILMYETTADGYRVALSDRTVLDFGDNGNFKKASK